MNFLAMATGVSSTRQRHLLTHVLAEFMIAYPEVQLDLDFQRPACG